jgi:hypothetical protein
VLSSANVPIVSSTIARNTADQGGGIFMSAGTATVRGTIVAQNTGPSGKDCAGTVASQGFNLIGSTTGCTFGSVASDRLNRAARLGLLRANGGLTQTISLLNGSPALNAIPKAQCPTTRDQRAVKRPQGTRCDIGAFERRPQD